MRTGAACLDKDSTVAPPMPESTPDASAESTALTSVSPPSQAGVEISRGQHLMVVLDGGNVKLRIEQNVRGEINISSARSGGLRPRMIIRPGIFYVTLAKYRFGNKFDFFKLPGEIRNEIYSMVFEHKAARKYPDLGFDFFSKKRMLRSHRFLAHLNKEASSGTVLPFLNRQTLRETTPWLMRRHIGVEGDKQALALFKSIKSISFYDLGQWKGSLLLFIPSWEEADAVDQWVPMLLNSGWSQEIKTSDSPRSMTSVHESRFKFEQTPLGQLLVAVGRTELPSFVVYLNASRDIREAWVNYAINGFKDRPRLFMPPTIHRAKKIYDVMERSVRGEVAQR